MYLGLAADARPFFLGGGLTGSSSEDELSAGGGLALGLAFFGGGLAGWAAWSWDRGTSSSLEESDMACARGSEAGKLRTRAAANPGTRFFYPVRLPAVGKVA